jgi:hypothetical protein
MAIQLSSNVRDARLEAVETAIGTGPRLRILTGAPPASCATAQSGTLLVEMTLPADWMSAAASGVKAMLGTWQANATAAGTAGYFRILNSGATICHLQGTVTATGGGGDMTVDNASIASGQQVAVNTFSLTEANA